MIPLALQDALVKELGTILKPLKFKNRYGKLSPVNIYSQYLPVSDSSSNIDGKTGDMAFDFQGINDKYESLLPFVVVYLQEGVIQTGAMAHSMSTGFAIGVYDNDGSRQGYRDVMLVISKITERFEKNDILANKFIAQFPVEWSLQEPDDITCPCFYGSMVLDFATPTYRRECIHA